jgi:hypothetical protein
MSKQRVAGESNRHRRGVTVAMEERRARVVQGYIQGKTLTRIAEEEGINVSIISRDLKAVRQHWQENNLLALDEYKNKELTRLDTIEMEFWACYHKHHDKTNAHQYLTGLLGVVDKRCKILGLYAPVTHNLNGTAPVTVNIIEELITSRDQLQPQPEPMVIDQIAHVDNSQISPTPSSTELHQE